MKFDLEQFIFALSDTVDLVGVDEILHSKRVGYMAWKCAAFMDADTEGRQRFLHLGMLHDCGVSSTEERNRLMEKLDWQDSHVHCRVGAERLQFFAPLQTLAQTINYHHTRWEVLTEKNLAEETKTEANLLYLLDRVDYFCQNLPAKNYLARKDVVRNKILQFKDRYFGKDLLDIFLAASDNEAFWFGLEPATLKDFVHERKKQHKNISISLTELKTVATLFAQIVDAKSPFTAEHSFGVARLAKHLGELTGLDNTRQALLEIAGLLHDLGKLQVPDHVLDSPYPLDAEELSHMRHHSYATYHILHNITGLEEVAEWAGNHHEALDGSGYPFRKKADSLSVESRIIAVADVFQALAQSRPYREAEPLEKILALLENNSRKGRLDPDIVALAVAHGESCYEIATATRGEELLDPALS